MKILSGRFLLPIQGPILEDGAVVIDNEKILDVGKRSDLLAKHPDAEAEHFPTAVLMPGLVNAHTHLDLLHYDISEQRKVPFRSERSDKDKTDGGLGESRVSPNFFDWLVGGWEHRAQQTLVQRRECLDDGIRQLTRSGTTTVGDAGHYAGLIPQAINGPMRMALFTELLCGGMASSLQENYEAIFNQIEEIQAAKSTRITAGIAPYAAYTLSRHLLKIIAQQARLLQIPVLIHASETFSEMEFFYESTGEIAEKLFPRIGWTDQIPPAHRKTPVQYLESIGFLDQHTTLVGCNQLAEPDIEILAKTGTTVVHSPRSNALLKLGTPPLKKLRAAGVPVAIGTNGTASLHSLSIWDEMRYMQDHYPEGDRPSAEELLKMATLYGAKALGLDRKIGTLQAGKEADVIAVRVAKEVNASELSAWLIAHATDREIEAVVIEGKRIKTR